MERIDLLYNPRQSFLPCPPVQQMPENTFSSPAWEAPVDFNQQYGPDIPTSLLPEPFGSFAEALARSSETPPGMATLIVLGTLALILSRKFRIAVSRDFSEPLNLYTFIAMEPGNRKSSVFKACLEPIAAWERMRSLELAPRIAKIKSERATMEKIIEGKRLKAGKSDDVAEQKNLIDDITRREAELPIIPTSPQLFASDVTPESLARKLAEQNGTLGILTDEGSIIDVLGGLYNGGNANIDIILKGIDGGLVRIERKDERIDLSPLLTFVLAVQPAVLDNMASKKTFAGRGLLERFLFLIPRAQLGFRSHKGEPVPDAVHKAYAEGVKRLLAIPDKFADGELSQIVLNVEHAALSEWKAFQATIETLMRPGGELFLYPGWGSKLPGFIMRVAAIFHIARHGETTKPVDQKAMQDALMLGALLVKHGRIAFGLVALDPFTRQARDLWNWIKTQGKDHLTKSEITYGLKNRIIGKAETLDTLLKELLSRNLLRERKKLSSGRTATIYEINPATIEAQHVG